jgi:hypothetical protein
MARYPIRANRLRGGRLDTVVLSYRACTTPEFELHKDPAMAHATVKNQERIIANEKRIIKGQERLATIIRNQEKIIRNQQAIIRNQKKILSNQSKLRPK